MSAADPLAQILNKSKCTLQKKNQKIIRFIVDNNECGLVAVSATPLCSSDNDMSS
jgi:hypothetical protein